MAQEGGASDRVDLSIVNEIEDQVRNDLAAMIAIRQKEVRTPKGWDAAVHPNQVIRELATAYKKMEWWLSVKKPRIDAYLKGGSKKEAGLGKGATRGTWSEDVYSATQWMMMQGALSTKENRAAIMNKITMPFAEWCRTRASDIGDICAALEELRDGERKKMRSAINMTVLLLRQVQAWYAKAEVGTVTDEKGRRKRKEATK